MIVRLLNLDEMLAVFEEGRNFNAHLNMTRIEYFEEFGYGDDFGGFSFPLPETVKDAGELIKIEDSENLRIRDGVALSFTDDEFTEKLRQRDGE